MVSTQVRGAMWCREVFHVGCEGVRHVQTVLTRQTAPSMSARVERIYVKYSRPGKRGDTLQFYHRHHFNYIGQMIRRRASGVAILDDAGPLSILYALPLCVELQQRRS